MFDSRHDQALGLRKLFRRPARLLVPVVSLVDDELGWRFAAQMIDGYSRAQLMAGLVSLGHPDLRLASVGLSQVAVDGVELVAQYERSADPRRGAPLMARAMSELLAQTPLDRIVVIGSAAQVGAALGRRARTMVLAVPDTGATKRRLNHPSQQVYRALKLLNQKHGLERALLWYAGVRQDAVTEEAHLRLVQCAHRFSGVQVERLRETRRHGFPRLDLGRIDAVGLDCSAFAPPRPTPLESGHGLAMRWNGVPA